MLRKLGSFFSTSVALAVHSEEHLYCASNTAEDVSSDMVTALIPRSKKELRSRVDNAKKKATAHITAVKNISQGERTYENTIRPLGGFYQQDNSLRTFETYAITNVCEMLAMLEPDDTLRSAFSEAYVELQTFGKALYEDKSLFLACKEYERSNFSREEASLTREEVSFFERLMTAFRVNGFDLSEEDFARYSELSVQELTLVEAFDRAINSDHSQIEVNESELDGVDQATIQNFERTDAGKCILRCDYPTHAAIMKHCHSSDIRQQYQNMFSNRCYPENVERLEKILALRDEKAQLLGYDSYAASSLVANMAGNPQRVSDFIHDLMSRCEKQSEEDFQTLTTELPEGVALSNGGRIHGHDLGYVSEWYRQRYFNLDSRKVAEYFPVEPTIDALFKIYQQFLGLQFSLIPVTAWSDDVRLLQVSDVQTGVLLGYIFLDLFPRKNKYPHACFEDIIPSLQHADGTRSVFVGMIVANFPKNTSERPGLLTFNDVQTFFHEFGHSMHSLLGRTTLPATAGTNVLLDFVETPSQMFERWVEQPEVLKKISSHYQTGKSMPDEMIESLISSLTFNIASSVRGQLVYSLISLDLHGPGRTKDSTVIVHELSKKYFTHTVFNPDLHMHASFGHLTGYNASYYGYMWSKVFADDLFNEIKKRGLLNSEVGRDLIEKVIGQGSSAHPDILLEDFLGRKPSIDAFLHINGIID